VSCLAGKYNPLSGQVYSTSCLSCSSGKQSAAGASACYTVTYSFYYTGSFQTWLVPSNIHAFTVDAYGAQGGSYNSFSAIGGKGGYISVSNISATPFVGQTLYIFVGGKGVCGSEVGGYNGGGSCPNYYSSGSYYQSCSGGGGTDIQTTNSSRLFSSR